MSKLYPCIWFNNNSAEAIAFYREVTGEVNILSENPVVTLFELYGSTVIALNGGDMFRPGPAVSYFIYCGGDQQRIEHLYERLQEGGQVRIPLGTYDWSAKYAWVEDRFGINWQLDIDPINNVQKVVPALLFCDQQAALVSDAKSYYTSVFPEHRKLMDYPFPAEAGMPEGALLFTQFQLGNLIFNAMSGGAEQHGFVFTEGNSFVVECDTQQDIDHFWNAFAKEGQESRCGWIKDRFGVSWQIIPSELGQLMNNPQTGHKVTEALMKMNKLDIAQLKKAAGQDDSLSAE